MWVTNDKATGVGLPTPVGAQIISPHDPDSGYRAAGFNVCPGGFWSCF
jgi:hypothetical protein